MDQHPEFSTGFVRLPNRAVLRLSGADRLTFLQGYRKAARAHRHAGSHPGPGDSA